MPRTEARVFTSIWKDREFIALPLSAQRLYMFLLSQEDLTYCGVMPLRPSRWASKAPDTTVTGIEQDLKALEATACRLVVTDSESAELLVRSLMRRDGVWKQPNLLKLARESAEQVESPMIRDVMLSELRRLPLHETGSVHVKTLVADFIADLEQGTDHPTDYPPDDPTDHPHPDGSPDPSDNHYARAQGTGERNGSSDTGSPVPLFPEAPNPLPRDHKNGTRLPDDFVVTAEMVAWARKEAPHVDGKRETDRFVDYWLAKPGKDGRKLDWDRTWKNWMRTAEDRQGPRDRPGSRPSRGGASDDLSTEVYGQGRTQI